MRRATGWTIGWLVSAALYLLLIDITDLPELIVGAGAAILAATGLELAREQGLVGESIRSEWLLRARHAFAKVPLDILLVSLAAIRALLRPGRSQGRFRAVSFRTREAQRREVGKRALSESLGSFAPNTIVVGVDPERELILVHQLWPSGGGDAVDVLGLG